MILIAEVNWVLLGIRDRKCINRKFCNAVHAPGFIVAYFYDIFIQLINALVWVFDFTSACRGM